MHAGRQSDLLSIFHKFLLFPLDPPKEKEAIVEVIYWFVEISLAEIGHPGPPLQMEPLALKHLHSSLHLLSERLANNFHFLRGFMAGDALDVGSEGEDQGDHKKAVWLEAEVDVLDDGDWFVAAVEKVEGRDEVIGVWILGPGVQL